MKIDEDLPRQITDMLNACRHDARTVLEQGWRGAADDALWWHVQAETRWLVTADKGFADLRRYPPGTHVGLILLRPREESRRAYLELAAVANERLDLQAMAGAVAVVTERGIRIRRPSNR